MKYEIGQKVETPLGVGVINALDNIYTWIIFKQHSQELPFKYEHLKPYHTPHEKLIDLGYECEETYSGKKYINTEEDETLPVEINIDKHNTYYIPDNDCVNLELSRILTEYLELLEEEK